MSGFFSYWLVASLALGIPLWRLLPRYGMSKYFAIMFATRLAALPIPFARSALYTSMNFACTKSASVVPSGPCVSRYQRSASRP